MIQWTTRDNPAENPHPQTQTNSAHPYHSTLDSTRDKRASKTHEIQRTRDAREALKILPSYRVFFTLHASTWIYPSLLSVAKNRHHKSQSRVWLTEGAQQGNAQFRHVSFSCPLKGVVFFLGKSEAHILLYGRQSRCSSHDLTHFAAVSGDGVPFRYVLPSV